MVPPFLADTVTGTGDAPADDPDWLQAESRLTAAITPMRLAIFDDTILPDNIEDQE